MNSSDLINTIDYGTTPDEAMAIDMTRRAAMLDKYATEFDKHGRRDIAEGTAMETKGEAMAAKGTQDYAALKQGIGETVPSRTKKSEAQRAVEAYRMRAAGPKLAIKGRRLIREGRNQLAEAEALVREAKRLRRLVRTIDKAIARGETPVLPGHK